MAIQQDIKRERADKDAPEDGQDEPRTEGLPEGAEAGPAEGTDDLAAQPAETDEQPALEAGESDDGAPSPTQLGARRFVYAAYFAGAIAIAFLASKVFDFAWLKLQAWKPVVGEPRDEIVMPVAALLGALVAIYYWNRTRARQLAEEVAAEMSKVTWPTRTEVTNGTFVVIVTTIVSTVFFALMDKFWGFVTNLVYGGS
jgi:preprotein translocase subunit SecE